MAKRIKSDIAALQARTQKFLDTAKEGETQRQHAAGRAIEAASNSKTVMDAADAVLATSNNELVAKAQMKAARTAVRAARTNVHATARLADAARETFNAQMAVVTALQIAEQTRVADLERISAPLDWMPGVLGLPWTRAGHIDEFCNGTLAALLLGLRVLEQFGDPVPFVDPEVLEEAFGHSVRLYGATVFVQMGSAQWFGAAARGRMAGVFRTPDTVGAAWHGAAFGTKTIYPGNGHKDAVGEYTGFLESSGEYDRIPNMQPHGSGTTTYKDGSVHTGEYARGARTGSGTLRDCDGIIYTGNWNGNPDGEGRIRVAPGTYHQGSFHHGFSTSLDLDLVSDISPIVRHEISDTTASRLRQVRSGMSVIMTGTDLVGVVRDLLADCQFIFQ